MNSDANDVVQIHFKCTQAPEAWVETHLSEGLKLSRNMIAWRQRWAVLFDHLQCTDCQRLQNIWLADEAFKHDHSCGFSDERGQHPWHDLASILGELPSPRRTVED
ncbi:hypothetical protein [Pseudomonas sp.]|uniref:hypothetical protein n=1 Tax=Pseudomonas sp. TaxID=306 RepID=UPI00262AFAD7|nr:hypothetical protein [Pseudomonas sp.]